MSLWERLCAPDWLGASIAFGCYHLVCFFWLLLFSNPLGQLRICTPLFRYITASRTCTLILTLLFYQQLLGDQIHMQPILICSSLTLIRGALLKKNWANDGPSFFWKTKHVIHNQQWGCCMEQGDLFFCLGKIFLEKLAVNGSHWVLTLMIN
jgi:hypothetical protein